MITHLLVRFGVHNTFTRTTGGRSHIYSFAKPLSKLRLLLISDERLTMSRKCWRHLTLVYVRWAKPTLIKDGGNFSCSRLCNIFLVRTLLGPRDNLFSEDFHLLKCQKLVRLDEYPRSKNQDATKIQHIPFQDCRIFFVRPINCMWEQHLQRPNMIRLP